MKDNYKINFEQNKRQIELLDKYYGVNKETKTISVSLHYERASDILTTNVGNPKYPQFSNEALDKVKSITENAPTGYKVEINFEIEDYEGYKPKDMIEAFNDTLELSQYNARKRRQGKELLSSVLILIGVIILFLMVVGNSDGWFGEGVKADIITEVIDIAAWVFIWEAVTILFLEHSEQAKFALRIRQKVSQIAMYKKGEKKPLAIEKSKAIFGKWENEEKIKRVGKYFMLISSFAFIFMSFYSLYSLYKELSSGTIENNLMATFIIVSLLSAIVSLLAGLGGISRYLGGNGKLGKFVGPYAIFLTVCFIALIIFAISINDVSSIISVSSTFVIDLFYIAGYYIDRYIK